MSEKKLETVSKDIDIDLIGEWIKTSDLAGHISITRKDIHLIVLAFTETITTCRNMLAQVVEIENSGISREDFVDMNNHFVRAYERVADLINGVATRDLQKIVEEDEGG